jgi:hypothetical protein
MPAAAHGAAYYILTAGILASPQWPGAFQNYSLFIASPSLTVQDVERVHTDVSGSKVLAYYCSSWVYLGAAPCGMDRFNMSGHFNTSLAITNLDTHQPACIVFGPSGGVGGYIFSKASVDAIAAYHRDVTLRAGGPSWDGIYLDELDDRFPARWKTTLLNQTKNFDINGDGKADSLDALDAQYIAWRPYFTRRMREVVGPDRLLIGNGGAPATADPALNGRTIEFENCCDADHGKACPASAISTGLAMCRTTLAGQAAVSASPPLSVLWHTHENVLPASVQCKETAAIREDMPFVLEGDDREDGSWHSSCM